MRRLLAIVTLLAILVAGVVYNLRARNAPALGAAAPAGAGNPDDPLTVTVATARRRLLRQELTLIGVLRADRQAAISARVPGRILAVLVREGDRVRAGQPLVRMDIGDAQAQVAGAAAGVAAAEAQYRKAIDGKRARRIEMDASIAEAEAGLRTALARQRQAELALQLTDRSAVSDKERAEAAVRQAEAGLRQAETGLNQANETLKRLKLLYSRGGIARADLEGAQAQADIAQAQYDSAVAGLEQARAAARPAAETVSLRAQVSEADAAAARAGVRQAEAGLRSARRAKAEALRIADRDIEAARAQVAQARAGTRQAVAQVGNGTLTSPFEGVVTNLAARAGEFAQPGMTLMQVVGTESVYLEASAPVRYAASLRPGLPARVTSDALNRPVQGVVAEVVPVAGADNRSLPVRIRLQVVGLRLTPGATAEAVVALAGRQQAVAVPADALRSEHGTAFVYVIADGRAQRRAVTVGATQGEHAQIRSGLAEGEKVIVTGPAALADGAPVRVVEE